MISIALSHSVADAINKVRAAKLDLFSESMDSYANSVLELFNFVVEDDGTFFMQPSP